MGVRNDYQPPFPLRAGMGKASPGARAEKRCTHREEDPDGNIFQYAL